MVNHNPVATAPGSVFVNRKFRILPSLVQTEPVLGEVLMQFGMLRHLINNEASAR